MTQMYKSHRVIFIYENHLEVFILPRAERNVDITAPLSKVFDILNDIKNANIWNLAMIEINELEPGKFSVKSNLGDFTLIRTETVENVRISSEIEGGIFNTMGYVLESKDDLTNVICWGEFDDEKNEKILVKAAKVLLKSLKIYVEYIEEGGDPDSFDKKRIMVSP